MEPQLGSGCHGKRFSRRQVLKQAAASTALALTNQAPLRAEEESPATDSNLEIQIARISDCIFRLTISPLENGQSFPVPDNDSLPHSWRDSLSQKFKARFGMKSSPRISSSRFHPSRLQLQSKLHRAKRFSS